MNRHWKAELRSSSLAITHLPCSATKPRITAEFSKIQDLASHGSGPAIATSRQAGRGCAVPTALSARPGD